MNLSRIELDEVGSPAGLAARIHELSPDLAPGFDIEAICRALDITEIIRRVTRGFEAVLVTDAGKSAGGVVLNEASRPERQRFSLGHELGHFLLPHMPRPGEGFTCSLEDLRCADTTERNRHKRIEAEANRFAAHLLMPPRRIKARLERKPDLAEILRLAAEFKVSKEPMARSYIDAHPEPLAVVITRHGRIDRIYRSQDFPWIDPAPGQQVPTDSVAAEPALAPGEASLMDECDPETWIGERSLRNVEVLSEQVLGQALGYAMVLLHAELT